MFYPIGLTESHNSQSVKSIGMLGAHCTNEAPTMPPQGMGSHSAPILTHNLALLINQPTRATHK